MKLTAKEIKQQKTLFGSKAVNYFIRFMEAKKRWPRLPDYFIKQVIENSNNLQNNKN
tara:strand:- start:307 stop:477 length:171 start_codon:yes stop_codon:yes gene_type:complete